MTLGPGLSRKVRLCAVTSVCMIAGLHMPLAVATASGVFWFWSFGFASGLQVRRFVDPRGPSVGPEVCCLFFLSFFGVEYP